MHQTTKLLLLLLGATLLLALAACGGSPQRQAPLSSVPPDLPPVPTLVASRVAQGEGVYNQYCAACHGPKGEGQPNWKTRNSDGSLPPPPHNSSGHTWHHADAQLTGIIANGNPDFPGTRMPAFRQQLSEEEMLAVLEYIKTWWGPQERDFQWQVTWQSQKLQ